MGEYILSERAKRDLCEIGDYTEKAWSEEQAVKYLRFLFAQFKILSENPLAGKPYAHVKVGLHGCRCGRHIIFYRIRSQHKVRIVRILHERMDYPRHLSGIKEKNNGENNK